MTWSSAQALFPTAIARIKCLIVFNKCVIRNFFDSTFDERCCCVELGKLHGECREVIRTKVPLEAGSKILGD